MTVSTKIVWFSPTRSVRRRRIVTTVLPWSPGGGNVRDGDAATRVRSGFAHSAFLYETDAAYAAVLVPFLIEGLTRDEVVAVAAGPDRIALLRDALGADAAHVRFLSADGWYVRPVRTIAAWAQILRNAAAAGRPSARLVSQADFADQDPAWVRFEAAVNASLAGLNGHLLCPYDRRIPTAELAGRTHPVLHDDGWRDSSGYQAPELVLRELIEPAYPVAGLPIIASAVADGVAGLRAQIRERASAEAWLPPDRLDILILAFSELATNGIRHGGANRELRIWLTPDAVVCELTDDGVTPPGPLAGYLPPDPGMIGGMGLWIVYQLCDSLTIHVQDGLTRARFAVHRG
jgi:anti-sigma regulatory factor (Ser/Thr protein kinase)